MPAVSSKVCGVWHTYPACRNTPLSSPLGLFAALQITHFAVLAFLVLRVLIAGQDNNLAVWCFETLLSNLLSAFAVLYQGFF